MEGLPGLEIVAAEDVEIGPADARWVPVRVQLPAEAASPLAGSTSPISFRIERVANAGEPVRVVTEKSTFLVPR